MNLMNWQFLDRLWTPPTRWTLTKNRLLYELCKSETNLREQFTALAGEVFGLFLRAPQRNLLDTPRKIYSEKLCSVQVEI